MAQSACRNLKKDISKYRQFIEQCFDGKEYTLENVAGGCSYDIKVKAHCDGKDYIIKVIEGNLDQEEGNQNRIVWYEVLNRIRRINPSILGPVWYDMVNGHVVTITEWIHGEQLNDVFEKKPDCMIPVGKKAGKLLHELHHQKIVRDRLQNSGVSVLSKTSATVTELEREIKKCSIDFHGMDRAIFYLQENQQLISEDRAGIVHNDIRPENFISADGNLYLYDFDSGTIQDCFADFTYLSAISQEKYCAFSYAAIMSYFNSDVPTDFWRVNLYFSIMKLLDYAIYKYHKTGKMIINQADNFIRLFDNYEEAVPSWWKQADELYCQKL